MDGYKEPKTLNRLIRLGWVQENREKDLLALHPLISEVVLKNLKPQPDNCPGIAAHLGTFKSNTVTMNGISTRISLCGFIPAG